MEYVTLDRKQQTQARILTQLLAGKITTQEAASSLGKSIRWVELKRPAFRGLGPAALVHGNTGRPPWNVTSEQGQREIQGFAREKYVGFNFQHLTEKLNEDEGVSASASTIRRYCLADGIAPPRPQKRRQKHRKRRDRRRQEGELLQLDGSPHDWLEGRGPRLTLINFIDDATGMKRREFREGEDLEGYMLVMWRLVAEFGIPGAVYTDRTVIVAGASQKYKRLTDEPPGQSQFGRALAELGITVILANSAQAKGRVERTHGTDQDRLTSELRLANACSLKEANAVLIRCDRLYGNRFTVTAADSNPAWRPRPEGNLADIFCIKEDRIVANDNTVRYFGQVIDIRPGPLGRSYAGLQVLIHRRYDGTLGVFLDGQRIGGQPARSSHPPKPETSQPRPRPTLKSAKSTPLRSRDRLSARYLPTQIHPPDRRNR